MNCLCDGSFTCSVCQDEESELKNSLHDALIEKTAEYITSLDEGGICELIESIHDHSPNIENIINIKIFCEELLERLNTENNNSIYCPMCDEEHNNNTECQSNYLPCHFPE